MTALNGVEFMADLDLEARTKLLDLAEDRTFDRGESIIKNRRPVNGLWLVSEGVLEVRDGDGAPIGRLGPGSLVGELSYALDGRATADVVALERTMVLFLAREPLDELLDSSPQVASSFWRAIARTTSNRLIGTAANMTRLARVSSTDTQLPLPLREALDAFKEVISRVESHAVADGDVARDIDATLSTLGNELEELLADPDQARKYLEVVRMETWPALMLSDYGRRVWEKPRGYAGDWETIEMMYRNSPSGVGRVGKTFDAALLRQSGPTAARNRRPLLAAQITAAAEARPARVTSLACGPAREITDVLDKDAELLGEINLLDLDGTALDNAASELSKRSVLEKTRLHKANLIKIGLGRETVDISDQDLVYSIGLIDYFPDDLVIALLNIVHGWLRPGGRVILGNFHPRNPDIGIFELFEWSLIHRTEEDMHRLYQESAFSSPCSEILFEEQGVNLFAIGTKA